MNTPPALVRLAGLFVLTACFCPSARAQNAPGPSHDEMIQIDTALKNLLNQEDPALKGVFAKYPNWDPIPVPVVTDRMRMLARLNIPSLPPARPAGVSENHDEAKANPYPNLPDPLKLKNGQPVTTAEQWWSRRRPEIFEDMMTEVYGKIPPNTPKITWEVTATEDNGTVKRKNVVGHIDNSSYPALSPTIQMTVYTPSNASGPVPMIVNDGPGATGMPNQQVLDRGWGYAIFSTNSVQPDSEAGLTQGIIGLMNKGQPRSRLDEWGVLSAWAWGLSKSIDYFETDKDVDAKQLAVEGFSRWGKTAILAAAVDPRWVLAWAGDSGEGGAKLNRRDFGETVDDIAQNFPYWMAGNFLKYANGHWDDLPVDSHEAVALVAPRPVFITGGTTDQHADSKGMFLAAVGAGPVYVLLGKKDLGTTEMPAADVALISGDLGYRMHTGAHIQTPDWPTFLDFAAKYLKAPPPKTQATSAAQ